MEIAISSVLLKQLTDHAATSADEVCGLVFGDETRIAAIQPCANVAAMPAARFEIDPAALIAAYRGARAGGARPIGHYHSHPRGSSLPSPRDAAAAVEEGAVWLIVGAAGVRAWRAIRGGAVEGQFEPIALRITG